MYFTVAFSSVISHVRLHERLKNLKTKVDDDISGDDKFGSKYSEGAERKIIRPVTIRT